MLVAVLYSAGGADRANSPGASPATAPGAGAAEPWPAAKGKPVVSITGVAHGNKRAHVTELDFATLDRAASEEITIIEPFLKREMTFKGISMREFLQRAGVGASAGDLYMHALDDYHVSLPIAGLREAGFLATRGDGKKLTVATGGPIRLVFTGDGTLARNSDNWIWSFDSARVER